MSVLIHQLKIAPIRLNAPRSVGAAAESQKVASELILKSPLESFAKACA